MTEGTAPSDYVELHCHSSFSLLDGASAPEALVARAAALGQRALALTDHDDLGGAVRFAQAAHDADVAAIIGAELTVEEPGGGWRVASEHTRETSRAAVATPYPPPGTRLHHLVLLAESRDGYANLATLITRARMDRPRGSPAVSFDLVARFAPQGK